MLVNHFVLHDAITEERAAIFVGLLLAAYCAFIYWRGYATFKKLQVAESVPLELRLPDRFEGLLARPWGCIWAGVRGPFASLVRKELRLQQPSFLITGLFCLIAAVGVCGFLFPGDWGAEIVGGDFAVYLLLIPFIIGAVAVAEERGWGISEWHLTLPASALRQWSAKMLVTLSASLFLGLLLPLALFLVGWFFLRSPHEAGSLPPASVVLIVVASELLVASVAIYAGTFSTSALRAILWAFGIILVGCLVSGLAWGRVLESAHHWARPIHVFGPATGQGIEQLACWLVAVGLFLILGLVQFLAWSNFRHSGLPARRFAAQLAAVFIWVGLLAIAILTYVACCFLTLRTG